MTHLINGSPVKKKYTCLIARPPLVRPTLGINLGWLLFGLVGIGPSYGESQLNIAKPIVSTQNYGFKIYEGVDSIIAPQNTRSNAIVAPNVKNPPKLAKLKLSHKKKPQNPLSASNLVVQPQHASSRELIRAISNNEKKLVYTLLDQGADINAINSKNSSALTLAAMNQNAPLVRTLVNRGAKVNNRNQWGWTALLSATIKGDLEIVDLLLEHGADPDLAGNDGRAPIIAASWNRYPDIVERLLRANANVNLANRDGWTALSFAAWNGDVETVKILLSKSADETLKTYDRLTPRQLAELRGHSDLFDLLH